MLIFECSPGQQRAFEILEGRVHQQRVQVVRPQIDQRSRDALANHLRDRHVRSVGDSFVVAPEWRELRPTKKQMNREERVPEPPREVRDARRRAPLLDASRVAGA